MASMRDPLTTAEAQRAQSCAEEDKKFETRQLGAVFNRQQDQLGSATIAASPARAQPHELWPNRPQFARYLEIRELLV